jgi:hypothetical protein
MFAWLRKALAGPAAARLEARQLEAQAMAAHQAQQALARQEAAARRQRAQELAQVLLVQGQQATTARQLGVLQGLAAHWLPPAVLQPLEQALQARLVALTIRTPGPRKSTGSSARTARSTSKRRRRR